jgi:hypothetical protein
MEALPYEIYLVVDNARSQALTRAWDRFDDASVASVDHSRRHRLVLVARSTCAAPRSRRWIGNVVAAGWR